MSLPLKLPYDLMLTKWAAQINPLLANPIMQGLSITGIIMAANTPVPVSTGLNRVQQGWFLIDNVADCRVWRVSTSFNATNIILQSNAATTIAIWVF